ncbi:MAG: hypothetical protein FJZ95_07015 [Chloroflexi bacterium]|nr:hypothetical protein [Chloroflexota bacterium]
MTGSGSKQANFTLPADLIEEMRQIVPRGEQSKVVADALRKELRRLKFRRALEGAFGVWKDAEHPELGEGTDEYIRKLRSSSRMGDSEGQ